MLCRASSGRSRSFQHGRAIVERFGISGSGLKRRVEARQGVPEPDQLLQRNAAVIQHLGIAWADGQQPVERGDGWAGLAKPKLDGAEEVEARDIAGCSFKALWHCASACRNLP